MMLFKILRLKLQIPMLTKNLWILHCMMMEWTSNPQYPPGLTRITRKKSLGLPRAKNLVELFSPGAKVISWLLACMDLSVTSKTQNISITKLSGISRIFKKATKAREWNWRIKWSRLRLIFVICSWIWICLFPASNPSLNFCHSHSVQKSPLNRNSAPKLIKTEIEDVCLREIRQKLTKNFFSLIIDEVTDISKKKFLGIMVQYIDMESEKTVCKLLSLKECSLSATADSLTLWAPKEISWEYFFNLILSFVCHWFSVQFLVDNLIIDISRLLPFISKRLTSSFKFKKRNSEDINIEIIYPQGVNGDYSNWDSYQRLFKELNWSRFWWCKSYEWWAQLCLEEDQRNK